MFCNNVFPEVSQNPQESNCVRVSFLIKLVASCLPACLPPLLKKRLWHRCFPVNFAKFLRTPFCRTPQGDCFWIFYKKLASNNFNAKIWYENNAIRWHVILCLASSAVKITYEEIRTNCLSKCKYLNSVIIYWNHPCLATFLAAMYSWAVSSPFLYTFFYALSPWDIKIEICTDRYKTAFWFIHGYR